MKGGRPVVEECGDDGDVIVLTDEDGKDHEFELIEILEVDAREYAVLAPLDGAGAEEGAEPTDEDEAIILRVETDEDGDRVFSDIEDDAEWEKVAEAWESSLDDEDWEEEEGNDDGEPRPG
jgi:uncharacterized protein YrzB (UPF0473 family)